MKTETKNTINMYQANDWELSHEEETYYVMKKNTATFTKHLILFVLTFWLFGVPNLIYHFVSNKSKKVFK